MEKPSSSAAGRHLLRATGDGGELGAGALAFPTAGSLAMRGFCRPAGQDLIVTPALGDEVGVIVGVVVAVGEDLVCGIHVGLLGGSLRHPYERADRRGSQAISARLPRPNHQAIR